MTPHAPSAVDVSPANLLPHRYPMLLVDRIVEVEPGVRLVAHKSVTLNEPFYAQRDPRSPYPSSLVVESWCQSAGVLATWDRPLVSATDSLVMLFASMGNVTFSKPVYPGSVMRHEVQLTRQFADAAIFGGRTIVDGDTAITVDNIVMAFRPATALETPGA